VMQKQRPSLSISLQPGVNLLFGVLCLAPPSAYTLELASNWQLNGFIAQSGLYSEGNNYFGDSKDSLSSEFFEAGLVTNAQLSDNWSLAAQVLSRRAGDNDDGTPGLDYAYLRYRTTIGTGLETGFRLGRFQLEQGLYNATRDVPFTRPSVLLPQSLYGENIRNSRFAHDGIQWYGEQLFNLNRVRWSVDYYKPISDGDETSDIFVVPVPGDIDGEWSWSANVVYEWNDGRGSIGLGYDNWRNSYSLDSTDVIDFLDNFGSSAIVSALATSAVDRLTLTDTERQIALGLIENLNPQTLQQLLDAATVLFPTIDLNGYINSFNIAGDADISSTVLSLEYNWPRVSVAAEYMWRDMETSNFDFELINERFHQQGYYVQTVWHVAERWDLMLRYDDFIYDADDRHGEQINRLVPGVPLHRAYAQDTTLGITWHIASDWMARMEWHNVEGTAWIPASSNTEDFPKQEYWNLVAVQLAYRF
jgi:hypothetical protein